MLRANDDFVATLAESARKTISEGYYKVEDANLPTRSMRTAILTAKGTPLITEVKFRSPSEGRRPMCARSRRRTSAAVPPAYPC